MPPAQSPDAAALLSPESVAALDELSGVEVLAGVHTFNRAAHIASLLDTVDVSLSKLHPSARAAVLVADGGSQDGTADVVRGWCDGEPRGSACSTRNWRESTRAGSPPWSNLSEAAPPISSRPPTRARRRRARSRRT